MDKRLDSADFSYKAALTGELDAIIKSCGYKITGNINSFFYLVRNELRQIRPEQDLLGYYAVFQVLCKNAINRKSRVFRHFSKSTAFVDALPIKID